MGAIFPTSASYTWTAAQTFAGGLRSPGSSGTNNLVIGGGTVTANNSVLIGSSGVTISTTDSVVIAVGGTGGTQSGSGTVSIGNYVGTSLNSSILGINSNSGSNNVVIVGRSSTVGTTSDFCSNISWGGTIGNAATKSQLIGSGTIQNNHDHCIVIGAGAISRAANSMSIAGSDNQTSRGLDIRWQGTTSTAAVVDIIREQIAWADATNASYKGRHIFSAYDASGNAREAMRYESDGTGCNFAFFAAGSWGGGRQVTFIANALVIPSTNPAGGGILYVESGALKYRGSSGTVTNVGNA